MMEESLHNSVARVLPAADRRCLDRCPSRATALILRETDAMRTGLAAIVHDISSSGVGLITTQPLSLGEQVKVRLENVIQRVQRDVRGVVRHVTEIHANRFRVGIELYTRFTPLDLCLLKSPLPSSGSGTNLWV